MLKNLPDQDCIRHLRDDVYVTDFPVNIFKMPSGKEKTVTLQIYKLPFTKGQQDYYDMIIERQDHYAMITGNGPIPFARDLDARITYLQELHSDCYLIIMECSLRQDHPKWDDRYNYMMRYAVIPKEHIFSDERISVKSSNINWVGYNQEKQLLQVGFKGKSKGYYQYSDVPEDLFEEFLESESKGKFFNKKIKGRFSHNKMYE